MCVCVCVRGLVVEELEWQGRWGEWWKSDAARTCHVSLINHAELEWFSWQSITLVLWIQMCVCVCVFRLMIQGKPDTCWNKMRCQSDIMPLFYFSRCYSSFITGRTAAILLWWFMQKHFAATINIKTEIRKLACLVILIESVVTAIEA